MSRDKGVLRLVGRRGDLLPQDDTRCSCVGRRGEGEFGRGADVDAFGEAVFGFEIVAGGVVFAEVGRVVPVGVVVLEAVPEILFGKAESFEQALGAARIDHVGGEGLGDLAEC